MADHLSSAPPFAPVMSPATGERCVRFVGDRLLFTLGDTAGGPPPDGWRALLRTNLGRADALRGEIIRAHARGVAQAGAAWRDIPMRRKATGWSLELPLAEVGYFKAKAYALDPRGWQHWPAGPDFGVSVHPDFARTANTIYCAFPRLLGPTKAAVNTREEKLEQQFQALDQQGHTVIPPSGKLRDLILLLPHIVDTLGCRILHLLPVSPTPTTFARFGRFGSPYASLNLTGIDPALVAFDKRTTGVDQFRELAHATHQRGARLFLDIVINHTGWASLFQEEHPEWFARRPNGDFASPGAWGVTWEDLVELKHDNVALWDELAGVFLTWCRRGVDGFRCDAGYMVPMPAWQFIIARVQQEFPETLFLLEGLGGAWDVTEALLTDGGMQWAYSELFQNYSGLQLSGYLDHALRQSQRVGLLVHYSETHDNERLAAKGRAWSLLRNRLCALVSVNGGFAFTSGVEWLALEKIDVHACRGLAWGAHENLVPELAALNRLLTDHPCFFDGAKLTRASEPGATVYALWRESAEGQDTVLVLVNTDVQAGQSFTLPDRLVAVLEGWRFDLLGQPLPKATVTGSGAITFALAPGACHCLARTAKPVGLSGEAYRRARAQAAWAVQALAPVAPVEAIDGLDWRWLAAQVERSPRDFLVRASHWAEAWRQGGELPQLLASEPDAGYPGVIDWTLGDERRVTLVPPGHWLLIADSGPFRATLQTRSSPPGTQSDELPQHLQSIAGAGRHFACFPPRAQAAEATLCLERYAGVEPRVTAAIRFLAPEPQWPADDERRPAGDALVLLTNGRGGMARLGVDLGRVNSKYDCVLGANPHSELPVDRHVFAKRLRVWVNADGFISPLDAANLGSFQPGPPAVWRFVAQAGDARTVEIQMAAGMLPGRNTTVFCFSRPTAAAASGKQLPVEADVRLTVRLDLEDRNFHWETKRSGGAEHHFDTHTRPLADRPGFAFTPAPDRQLRAFAMPQAGDTGARPLLQSLVYHPQPEWAQNIPHPVEQSRGQNGSGDAYSPGWFELPLSKGTSVGLVATAEATDPDETEIVAFKAQVREWGGICRAEEQAGGLASPAGMASAVLPSEATSGSRTVNHPELASLPVLSPHSGERVAEGQERGAAREAGFAGQLLRAARAFVVRRGSGKTVIAGYPWFLDWGRDTLICARGLLAAGMVEEVHEILLTFARFEDRGTLPNTIHGDNVSNRDTTDAPLWFGVVCEEFAARADPKSEIRNPNEARNPNSGIAAGLPDSDSDFGPSDFLRISDFGFRIYATPVVSSGRTVADVLRSIAANYIAGTPNGIRMDPDSALIWSPSHFTWMDTNYPAGTPREGYPIEIQCLWIRLLRQLERMGARPERESWQALADRARASLEALFWIEDRGWFADVLLAKSGVPAAQAVADDALRSNCLFAVSLAVIGGRGVGTEALRSAARARSTVEAARRYLVVPGALRSLAPLPVKVPLPIRGAGGQLLNNPAEPYWGRYEGDEDTRRKPAYHNGTAWTWTFPVFCEALARAWDDSPDAVAAARSYLGSADRLLSEGCLGQIPEILDGDAPHTQRGCDAQAWGVTEALRVWQLLARGSTPTTG